MIQVDQMVQAHFKSQFTSHWNIRGLGLIKKFIMVVADDQTVVTFSLSPGQLGDAPRTGNDWKRLKVVVGKGQKLV